MCPILFLIRKVGLYKNVIIMNFQGINKPFEGIVNKHLVHIILILCVTLLIILAYFLEEILTIINAFK